MTTTTGTRPACLMDVCEECGQAGARARVGTRHHIGGHPDHEFVPHVCTESCSAAFWRAFRGCNPFHDATNEGKLLCWYRPHGNHELADILGSPGTEEAWLAMREILNECERRGWDVTIDVYGVIVAYDVGRRDRDHFSYPATTTKDIPAAFAKAAWSAHLGTGATK